MPFLFTKLNVYKRSVDLADKITELTGNFPRGYYYLADQLNRAALSISLNIAEGNGRYHPKERQSFFRIARGSAFERIPIFDICCRRGLFDSGQQNIFVAELDEICKMLSALINKRAD